eukprot:355550-Chlamydomonas_euryale.AAC.5
MSKVSKLQLAAQTWICLNCRKRDNIYKKRRKGPITHESWLHRCQERLYNHKHVDESADTACLRSATVGSGNRSKKETVTALCLFKPYTIHAQAAAANHGPLAAGATPGPPQKQHL